MEDGALIKQTVTLWQQAADAQISGRYADALEAYAQTDGSSARILYNMACTHLSLNETDKAVEVSSG